MTYKQAKQRRPLYYSWDEVPVILDVVLVARILGYSLEYTRRMCQRGTIPANKVGGDWRISKETLRTYVEGAGKN